MTRRFLLSAALALAAAQPASAHAIPVSTSPANGAVLVRAPGRVLVTFSSGVRIGPRNAAIRNDGRNVLAGAARVDRSRTLVLPLLSTLHTGNYTVRWSIVSDDGHEQEGLIAFAVGAGSEPPAAALTTRGSLTWQRILMRTLFYLGILTATGAAFFTLAVLRPLGLDRQLERRQAQVLFFGFLLAFAGGDALAHTAGAGGTRFEHFVELATVASAVGAAAAALVPLYPRLRAVTWSAAAVLFPCATFSGHALDPDQPRLLAPAADLLHLGAAAVWLGGLMSLTFTVSRAPEHARQRTVRRFSELALVAVAVLAVAGLARALTELSSVTQLWSTSYGRALLVKSGLLLPLLVLGLLSRRALVRGFSSLVRLVPVELVLLTAVVAAVATLTDLAPGGAKSKGGSATHLPAGALGPSGGHYSRGDRPVSASPPSR